MSQPDQYDRPYSLFVTHEMLLHVEYSDLSMQADAVLRETQRTFREFADKYNDLFESIDQSERLIAAVENLTVADDTKQQAQMKQPETDYLPSGTAQVTFFEQPEGIGSQPYGAIIRLVLAEPSGFDNPSAILELSRLTDALREFNSERVQLKAFTPNWLHTVGATRATWGGPGALPVPPGKIGDVSGQTITDPDVPFGFRLRKALQTEDILPTPRLRTQVEGFSLNRIRDFFSGLLDQYQQRRALGKLNDVFAGRGRCDVEPVTVYVLDTAPAPDDLKAAFDKLQASNPLLNSLLAPNGHLPASNFNVTYYADIMPQDADRLDTLTGQQDGYEILQHEYDMSDHGLFVAGIIHSIAPHVQIELVQVLNDAGVGSSDTLANGLRYVLDDAATRKGQVVINASLLLALPSVQWLLKQQADGAEHPFVKQIPALQETIKHLGQLLPGDSINSRVQAFEQTYYSYIYAPIKTMYQRHYHMVASSGNDRLDNMPPPPARYPAAFKEVDGVGAITPNGEMTSYSNQSDRPVTAGLVTLGGMMHTVSGEQAPFYTDATQGILGLFLSDYPRKRDDGTLDPDRTLPNQNGFARWAGTSFAAPVVAGLLALLCAHGHDLPNASQILVDAQQEAGREAIGEMVLVEQG